MPKTESWTIGRLLDWTTGFLSSHQADTPRLDAELLLAAARNCERIDLYTTFDEVVDDETKTTFRELVRRRAEGVPVAYLLGRREFYSLDFFVTPDVLIPRPESEFIIVELVDLAQASGMTAGPLRIVDVGTGSGILAVCAARELPEAHVLAIDLSPAALAVAGKNVKRHELADRIELVCGDLLAPVPPGTELDFIICNPPYVRSDEMDDLAPEVVGQEPRMALEAGPKGTEIIERIVTEAADRLKPGGHLIMEISPMIHADVQSLLDDDSRYQRLPTKKDLAGLARVVSARRKSAEEP